MFSELSSYYGAHTYRVIMMVHVVLSRKQEADGTGEDQEKMATGVPWYWNSFDILEVIVLR